MMENEPANAFKNEEAEIANQIPQRISGWPKPFVNLKNKEEQIIETRDKPQHLATQRLLSCLQYPDATKSSTKDLSLPLVNVGRNWH